MKPVKFRSRLELTDSKPPWHILRVPKGKVNSFEFKGNLRRVICTLNGTETFPCALFPSRGDYFITLGKKLRQNLGVEVGKLVTIELLKDESKYGLPMPKELREVLKQDREGDKLFHALTAGKQRTMLYYISKTKDVDRRIHMSLILVEHLKNNEGKIIFPKLSEELKRPQFEI